MSDTKPTPAEIERAKAALCHPEHPMVERVAQALADARERCAVIAERHGEIVSNEPVGKACSRNIAADIRRGEP